MHAIEIRSCVMAMFRIECEGETRREKSDESDLQGAVRIVWLAAGAAKAGAATERKRT